MPGPNDDTVLAALRGETSYTLDGEPLSDNRYNTKLSPQDESEFQKWFASFAEQNKLAPNPDAFDHHYDARGFWNQYRPPSDWRGYLTDAGDFHLDDAYKLPGHPSPPYTLPPNVAGNKLQGQR